MTTSPAAAAAAAAAVDTVVDDDEYAVHFWAERYALLIGALRSTPADDVAATHAAVRAYLKLDAPLQRVVWSYAQKSTAWLLARRWRVTGSVSAGVVGRGYRRRDESVCDAAREALRAFLWGIFSPDARGIANMAYGTCHEPPVCLVYYLLRRGCFDVEHERGDAMWHDDGDSPSVRVRGTEYMPVVNTVLAWDDGDTESITRRVEHITTTGEVPDDILRLVRRPPDASNDLRIVHTGLVVSLEHPELGTSSDGDLYATAEDARAERNPNLLEIKCPASRRVYHTIPEYYKTQIQMSMRLRRMDYCEFAVWTPDELVVRRYSHDLAYSQTLLDEELDFFWNRFVPNLAAMARGQLSTNTLLGEAAASVPQPV